MGYCGSAKNVLCSCFLAALFLEKGRRVPIRPMSVRKQQIVEIALYLHGKDAVSLVGLVLVVKEA